jgi:3-(3-hydroxy-phenyl)propionate hydroxylase
MTEHAVVIAGGGPTGLMLSAELTLAGVDVLVIERRASQALDGSRAGGLHPRTLEVFDQRGIADRFIKEGQKAQVVGFGGVHFDMTAFPTRHGYTLGLWQKHIERILGGWVAELKVPIRFGTEVTGFAQDADGVTVQLSDRKSVRAKYLVGCDGGRSFVRKNAGIEFPGWDPTMSAIIAEVEMAQAPVLGMRRDPRGNYGLGRVNYKIVDGKIVWADEGTVRVMLPEDVGDTGEPTLDDLKKGLVALYGTDFGVHSPTYISRFTDMTRQAAEYRKGRVLLAGDSAHIHSPVGGQGLGTGVQDAVNLGWKLAQVVNGISPDSLLDTYHTERHPVGERVLKYTMAQVAMMRVEERAEKLRDVMAAVLSLEEPRRIFAATMSGLDIHYDMGPGHPLLGRRMPDLDISVDDAPTRVYVLLHRARPVLLNFRDGQGEAMDLFKPWSDRVQMTSAKCDGPWDLPGIGVVASPSAVLIRPDGHVAWVGEGSDAGLVDALTKWFGPANLR